MTIISCSINKNNDQIKIIFFDLISSRIENVVLDNVIVNEKFALPTLYHDLLEPVVKDL